MHQQKIFIDPNAGSGRISDRRTNKKRSITCEK